MNLAIVGGDPSIAAALGTAISARGAAVVTIGATSPELSGVEHLEYDAAVTTHVEAALVAAENRFGGPFAVVRLAVLESQTRRGSLSTLSLDEWIDRGERPLHESFAFHQATQRFLAARGGRVIVVLPTVGLSGSPGLVPWATTAEADRSLAKAQARAVGHDGITVNCVALSSSLLAAGGADLDRTGLPPLSVAAPDLGQAADVIVALLGPAFVGVTGQTIAVDGGRWMTP